MGSLPHLSVIKGPTREFEATFVDQLFESVANGAAADNIAVIFEENGGTKRHTYSELNTTTNQLAKVIVDLAKTEKSPRNPDNDLIVAVSLHPSDKLITTLLAIWKAGAAYLPLDPTFPQNRIDHILTEAQPFLLICEDNFNSSSTTVVMTFNELLQSSKLKPQDDLKNTTKQDVAIVLYTSGSTGIPKGVRIPHRAIQNRLYWQFKTFPYGDDEKVCVFKTALTFVDSVAEIWGPLINGLSLLVVPKSVTKDPEAFVGLLERYKIERLVLVPSLLRSLLMYLEMQKEKSLLHKLKTWVCSGETLAVSLVEDFFKYFPENEHQLCNFYGSTEIMGDVTYHIISNPQQLRHLTKVPIGLPVDNTTIHLLTDTLTPVKSGEIGELFVSGLNLAAGYVNQRDPDKFLQNPHTTTPTKLYTTGDFARLDKGIIMYEGRTDSQIKIRGHRVDLSEVEKALLGFEEVEKAVVLCYRPGELNQALLGFVVARRAVSESEIEGRLLEKVPEYMVPQVVLIKDVPLLVNGKVDRQALLKSYENNNNEEDLSTFKPQIDYTGVPENNMAAAKILFETIASVLQRSARAAISIKSNFFESGGNSLNSIYTITRLNEQGYQISIADFLAAKTLADVLEKMDGNQNVALFGKFDDNYKMELLKDEHQAAVIDIITTSFYRKAELERYISPLINESDYEEVIVKLWDTLKAQNISFVVKSRKTGDKILGVALNTDARDEPEIEINSKLTIILEFLEFIEGPIRDNQLPPGKRKIFHSFMMGTHSSLSAQENVSVMHYMEEQVIRVAKENDYAGVLTTNTNPLTQQLGRDVYKYETLLEYTFNKYVDSEGKRPFAVAPDHEGALVQWKAI